MYWKLSYDTLSLLNREVGIHTPSTFSSILIKLPSLFFSPWHIRTPNIYSALLLLLLPTLNKNSRTFPQVWFIQVNDYHRERSDREPVSKPLWPSPLWISICSGRPLQGQPSRWFQRLNPYTGVWTYWSLVVFHNLVCTALFWKLSFKIKMMMWFFPEAGSGAALSLGETGCLR